MYLVLLKINNKIYFESLDSKNEMVDFIEAIESKYGEIEYKKSIVIYGNDEDINEIIELIEENYYLHIVGRKIDEKVYKDLIALIENLSLNISITYGIEFEDEDMGMELNEETVEKIINESASLIDEIENISYPVYIYWTTNNVVFSMSEIEDEFDESISFKQTFKNLDEAISIFEGFKHDFMELISEEDNTYFVVNKHLPLVQPYIEQKIIMMKWKETQTIKYMDGKYRTKKSENIFDEKSDEEYMTAKEVMKKLRISDQTLANWRRKGLVKFRRISNRKYLYYIESIQNIFENGIDTTGVNNQITTSKKQASNINYEKEILNMLSPIAFKIPEYKYKKQNFFLNFGNIGITSSPQVMINNNFQLVDFIRKSIIFNSAKELYEYLVDVFNDNKEPRIDTSKKIQPEFSNFYLNKLYDRKMVSS